MQPQTPTKPPANKYVILITAIAASVTALATLLLVPPAWLGNPWIQERLGRPLQRLPIPTAPEGKKREGDQQTVGPSNIGGFWRSQTSNKLYTFICISSDYFEIYENDPNLGTVKVGFGKIFQRTVEATFLSIGKGRMASLRLRLSEDDKKLEGTFQGLDARESGSLVFVRIQDTGIT